MRSPASPSSRPAPPGSPTTSAGTGHRGAASRPRHHLRRGRLPGPHRRRPTRHGLPAQPRHRRAVPRWAGQPRRRPPTPRPRPRPAPHHPRDHPRMNRHYERTPEPWSGATLNTQRIRWLQRTWQSPSALSRVQCQASAALAAVALASAMNPDARNAVSSTTSTELGPRWVRAATVAHGHQRSPTVTNGSEEPQVTGPPAQAAGMMPAGDSDCGPESRGGKAVRAYRAQKRAPRPAPRGFSFVKQSCLGPSPAVGVA